MTAAPLSRWAAEAQGALSGRAGVAPLSAADLIERGTEYFDSMRNKESEADFHAALTAPGLDAETACVASFHYAQSIFKQRDRTRAAPLFDAAYEACSKSSNQDLLVKASYQAGRSYSNIGKHDVAVLRYERAASATTRGCARRRSTSTSATRTRWASSCRPSPRSIRRGT